MSSPSTLIGRLARHAERTSERAAVVRGTLVWSWAELARRVAAQAERLGEAEIDAGSVVGIECADDVRHLVLCLAAIERGATSCTAPTHESAEQRERALEAAGATRVLGDETALDPLAPLAGEVAALRPEATARLLFSTSGTTGEPKIVVHRDAGLVAQAHRHVGPGERFACVAGMEHNFAKRHRLYCVAEGATSVFLDAGVSLVDACRALEVTTLHVSAFQAQELLALPDVGELAGIRLKLGGSHVAEELRRRLREDVTPDVHFGYGTTETGAIGFTEPDDAGAGESVGRALPGIEIRVTDADRRPVGAGERGEVAIRCDGMFEGYLGAPARTAACLADGWFHTGDVGHLDEERRLHLAGRADDMFVFNSLNVHPQEIEAQIRLFPTVVDAAVVPKRSPVHGDVPVAIVVLDGLEPNLRDLKKFVRAHAGLRTPRQFVVVDRVPRNAAGKIDRAAARDLLG